MKEVELTGIKVIVNGVRSYVSKSGDARQILDVYVVGCGSVAVFIPKGKSVDGVKSFTLGVAFGRLVLLPVF